MNSEPRPGRMGGRYWLVCATVTLLSAILLAYSQWGAFAWDEGFHLLAAQLIRHGKRPYLDFFFPQTPLNAYWNAFWMGVFGESWRTAHAVAAVMTSLATFLIADFVYMRLPAPRWRLAASVLSAVLLVTNIVVFQFGGLAQAYGLCLCLIVAAFRAAVASVERKGLLLAAVSGFFAGAAAGSSLLTAPVAPVLLIWIGVYSRAGSRWIKLAAFGAGAIAPLIPILRLFWAAPPIVMFNIFDFHLFYRQVEWAGALQHDLFEVLLAWTTWSPALILGLLAAAGVLYIPFRSGWDRQSRGELYLCGWLALALGVHVSSAHPTFSRYYLFTVPFLSILGAIGLFSMAERIYAPGRLLLPAIVVGLLVSLGLTKELYDDRDDRKWADIEKLAAKVDQVTPAGAMLLADESIYFLIRRPPPSGMESADSHKLRIAAAEAERMHILQKAELERRIKAGVFATAETCGEDDEIARLGFAAIYTHKEKVEECMIFWDPKR